MTVREAAALYISKGWPVIPLQPKTKKLVDADFDMKSRLRFRPEDFAEDDNIGLRSVAQDPDGGSPIVISDCDCDEAEALAEHFLPPTGAIWGRGTHPKAKRLYICVGGGIEKTIAFKDFETHQTFLELRANHQDMAPPSIHPETGEVLGWCNGVPGDAGVADAATYIRTHRNLGTAAMIARYYNPPTARHDWALALAGLLKQLNVSEKEANWIFERAAILAGDRKVADRLTEVRTTYAKGHDDAVAGAKQLVDVSSKNFVMTIKRIWGSSDSLDTEKRVIELNKRHAVLFQQSGDLIVLTEDVEDSQPLLRFSKPAVMDLLYPQLIQAGTTAAGNPVFKPLGTVWLKHPKRRYFSGIELCPNGHAVNPGYYNLWKGWAVEPKKGVWTLFREQIDLIADHNPEHAKYIIAWLAETVQHPDKPIGISLAFRGGQGTGKSTFARWFGSLFGHHFLHLDSEQRLLGRFNAHLHNAIVVFADEAVWAGGKQGLGALKRMVTEETLAIERKGIDTISVKNRIHMLIASNEDWFVPAGFDDRRFAIFHVSTKRQNDSVFFEAVHDELFNRGGLAALLYDLLSYTSDVNLRFIPETQERNVQKTLSLSPLDEWWREMLNDGTFWLEMYLYDDRRIIDEKRFKSEYRVDRELIYETYAKMVERANRRWNLGSRGALGRFLRKVLPEPYPRTYQERSTGKRSYLLPDLSISRQFYEKTHGKMTWDDAEEGETRVTGDGIPF